MIYNFDKKIDRKNTNCIKYDCCKTMFGNENILPMWIADMDFLTPNFILESVKKRLEHKCFGYSFVPAEFHNSIMEWQKKIHNWDVEKEWIGFVLGIVPSLSFIVQIFTEHQDEVIIQTPVYNKFIDVVEKNKRKLIVNPLKKINNKFEIDFDDLKKKINPKTKLLIICNPHNPGGRVWGKENLSKLAEICYEHQIIVVSDEIHADMTFSQYKHVPFASVSEKAKEISITLTAPTKTFNMPAFQTASYIIPNEKIRNTFQNFLDKGEIMNGNIFGVLATIAAYEQGNEWRLQMLDYVQNNIKFVINFFKNKIPQIIPMQPEASFLVWLDCSNLAMNDNELMKFMVEKVGVGFSPGTIFGIGGEKHLRMNVAYPFETIKIVMETIKERLLK